jgi:hypothetical protein
MKITIIAPNSFGYIDFLIDALKSKDEVDVTYINFSEFIYTYTSTFDKVKNAITKIIFKKNKKETYVSNCILKSLLEKETQDFIVVIRPDKLEKSTLFELKKRTKHFYAFYFDAISNFPKKVGLIPLFEKVFSYEKDDVKTYKLEFITNYIYDFECSLDENLEHKIFNISSYDERFTQLRELANYLKNHAINYNIIVRKERIIADELVSIVPEYLPLEEVKRLLLKSEILLDIQKSNQKGLSFRVFEALGYEKKLITTNKYVAEYDFYSPHNILIIDPENIKIPESFLDATYKTIPTAILYPYTLEGWIKKVFGI